MIKSIHESFTGPYQSKLNPFLQIILKLKSKGKSLREIQKYLLDEKQMKVSHRTIADFIRTRTRKNPRGINAIVKRNLTAGKEMTDKQTGCSKLESFTYDILNMYYEKQQPLSRIQEYLAEKGIATCASNLHFFIRRRSEKDLSPLNCSGETVDIDADLDPDMNTEAECGVQYVVREDWRKHVTREEYADIIYIAMFKVLSGDEGNALTSYVTSVHGLNHPTPTDENWDEGLRFIEDLRLNKYGIESLWIKTMLLANRKDLLKQI